MQKIIHKLNKEIRQQIAVNYVTDKLHSELIILNKEYDSIGERLFNKCKDLVNYEELIKLEKFCKENNYYFSIFTKKSYDQGLLLSHIKFGRNNRPSLKLKLYIKNQFYFNFSNDYLFLENKNIYETIINYSPILENIENIQGLEKINQKNQEIAIKASNLFNEVYSLLKKVDTVEKLLKHWSNSYSYLPKDIIMEEPKALSLSEKFSML